MRLDDSLVGRVLPATRHYEVGREKIREFADAIGDDDPVYRDPSAARAAGHPDVVAPPTFAVVITWQATAALIRDLDVELSRLLHADQRFELSRPVRVGDRLAATVQVDGLRALAGNHILAVRCEVVDQAGELALTSRATLVIRGTA